MMRNIIQDSIDTNLKRFNIESHEMTMFMPKLETRNEVIMVLPNFHPLEDVKFFIDRIN